MLTDVFTAFKLDLNSIQMNSTRLKNPIPHIAEDKLRRQGKARALSKCLHHLIEPICQKQGFINASIVLDWRQIVGQEFADLCQAIKVTFPFNSRRDGCLHVNTTSSMAAVLAYEEPLILEKINRYYGYQAISKLKVFHGLKIEKKHPSKPQEIEAKILNLPEMEDISYEPLREALTKLSQHIQRNKKRV